MDNTIKNEIWKDVKGYEGYYKVSNHGRVTKQDGSLMAICDNGTGYSVVYLCKSGVRKTKLVHRLVAKAFIPNKNGFKEINHKDEDKKNNHYSNLEWCTRGYNASYGTKIQRTITNKNYINTRKKKQGPDPSQHSEKKWPNMILITV